MILREVYAFIDWDTARRCAWLEPFESVKLQRRGVAAQLQAVYDALGNVVGRVFPGGSRVRPRLYHGWHRGNEPTVDRRALFGMDPVRRTVGKVLLEPPIIADALACGVQLRDTVRRRDDGMDEQKMVDTALCADLLWYARSEGARKADVGFVVMSEDDDMLPAVLTAEKWGVNCKILRQRNANRSMPYTQPFIHLLVQ